MIGPPVTKPWMGTKEAAPLPEEHPNRVHPALVWSGVGHLNLGALVMMKQVKVVLKSALTLSAQ